MRIYIDLDDTIFDYSGAIANGLRECPGIKYPQSQYGFFRNLELIEDALDTVLLLMHQHDVWFLTAPSFINPLSYIEKRLCIEDHFGMGGVKRLIICPDKSLLIGDVLIDDKSYGKGQDRFEGKLIQFGSVEYPDWKTVYNAINKREI
jgi:5'-nucleotidase